MLRQLLIRALLISLHCKVRLLLGHVLLVLERLLLLQYQLLGMLFHVPNFLPRLGNEELLFVRRLALVKTIILGTFYRQQGWSGLSA